MKGKRKVVIVTILSIIALLLLMLLIYYFIKGHKNDSNNIGKVYYHETPPEHIVVEDSGVMYADNEILIVAEAGAKERDIKKLADKYDAEIVGCIEATGDYQWLLSDVYDKDKLDALTAEIQSEEWIESACVNYVFEVSAESSNVNYGDKWGDIEWSSVTVGGKNWGLEAIHAMEAWEYMDQMVPIRLGLIDGGFDAPNSSEQVVTLSGTAMGHEDLEFAKTFYNDMQMIINKDGIGNVNHGTHVAGIMAANFENSVGICGVYPFGNSNLYGASFRGAYQQNYITGIQEKSTYAELILQNVKVINCSYGSKTAPVEIEFFNNIALSEQMNLMAESLAVFFEKFLNKGYDFVIVQSAGNASGKWYTQLRTDSDGKLLYDNDNVIHDTNGRAFHVVSAKELELYFGLIPKFEDRFYYVDDDGKQYSIIGFNESECVYVEGLESKYNSYISAISEIEDDDGNHRYSQVYNRIIVAGSFGLHNTISEEGTNQTYFTDLSISDFSNLGDRVDILAPGEDIFSTTYSADGNSAANKNQGVNSGDKYEFMSGTSMAAPHVAGVAAMVWSANNQLTGEEVKQLICKNADTIYHYDGGDMAYPANRKYGTLNAQHAVEAALDKWHKEIDGEDVIVVVLGDTEPENGGILGYVVDSTNQNPISEATVTAADEDGNEYTDLTDVEGHFELILPEGKYTVKISKEEYKEITLPDTYDVASETVITLQDKIELQPDPLVLYKDVLDMFYDNISNKWKNYSGNTAEGVCNSTNISDVYYQHDVDGWSRSECSDLTRTGYQFWDVNNDGSPELFVGSMPSHSDDIIWHDLYTVFDNQIIHLYSGGGIDDLIVCEDNEIKTCLYSGPLVRFVYYKIENGKLVASECFDADETSEFTFQYSNTSTLKTFDYPPSKYHTHRYYGGDFIFSNWKQIAENEYKNNGHKELELQFIPFSDYKTSSETNNVDQSNDSGGTNQQISETNLGNIMGIWYSSDWNQVFSLSASTNFGITESGISLVSGGYSGVSLNSGETQSGTFELSNSTITFYNSGSTLYQGSIQSNQMNIKGHTFVKVSDNLQKQFIGEWNYDYGSIEFEKGTYRLYSDGRFRESGEYYVLSETAIVLGNHMVDYQMQGKSLSLLDITFTKKGADNSADRLDQLENVIQGAWRDHSTEYAFYSDGTYTYCVVTTTSPDGIPTGTVLIESGHYDIYNNKTIRLYYEDQWSSWTEAVYNSSTNTLQIGGSSNTYSRGNYTPEKRLE